MSRPKIMHLYSHLNDAKDLMHEVDSDIMFLLNNFETAGCEGQGTVTIEAINKLRRLVGWKDLDENGEIIQDEGIPLANTE